MELSPLFLNYPLVWLFVGLIVAVFVAGNLLRRFALPFFITGALGLVALIIFSLLHEGSYLDVGLIGMICLLPLLLFFLLPEKKKETEDVEA